MPHRVVVAGGGPAGLSLAFFLRKLLPSYSVELFEASGRFGGWLNTERNVNGFMFERGCRGIRGQTAAGQTALNLVSALGLSGEALPADGSANNRFIWNGRHLVQAPKSISDVAKWELIPNKFSTLRRALNPAAAPGEDESVRDFVIRHFGSEVADNVVDAVLSGVYAGDISQLSSRAVLAALHRAERLGNGSVPLGMFKAARYQLPLIAPPADVPPVSSIFKGTAGDQRIAAARRSSSVNFVGGMQTLPDALVRALQKDSMVALRDNTPLPSLDGLGADGVFLACPARAAAGILRNSKRSTAPTAAHSAQRATELLDGITYGSVATVCMGWASAGAAAVLGGKEGFGYLVPSKQRAAAPGVLGVVWDSCTFPQQAPGRPGSVRVSVMMGGALNPEVLDETDAALEHKARSALEAHLGHKRDALPKSDATAVFRAAESIPQYTVGHVERTHQAREDVQAAFGHSVVLAGNSYSGVGIADTIQSSWEAAWRFAKSQRA